jgi:hypothetical protein
MRSSIQCQGKWRDLPRKLALPAFAIAAVWLALCLCAPAQTTQGFTGLVTDSTGAVIPKAKVTVHNQATGVDKSVNTTSTGNWTVPFLDPGIYDVRAEADKFKSVDKTNITLSTGETAEVNFSLVPGSATETVTVNASEDVLDYDKPDVGNVMENQLLEQLPDFDNNTFDFALYTPGLVTAAGNINSLAPGNQSAQSFAIHGASVEFSIDGVANISETGPEHYTMAPPPDSLQEFKITTSPVDAASGRAPSGMIDMTLKTGTRGLHGAAYEYMQRAFLNANTPLNDANISKNVAAGASAATIAKYNKAAFTQNQYGFELDGPVVVPKLWNGKKKQTFFMILYEDLHNQSIATSITSVPTTAMATGDFSGLLNQTVNSATYNEAIYDPTTEAACTANNTDNSAYASGHPAVCRYQYGYGPGTGAGPQGNPVLTGTPNVIPKNEINSVAQAIMSWYPAPNQSPTPTTANPFNNNYVGLAPSIQDNKSYIVKLDQNIGKNDTFDVTGKLWKFYGQNNNAFPRNNVNAAHPGINEAVDIAHYNGTDYRYPSLNVAWTHTFSPTLINAFRGLVTTALESDSTGPASGWDPSNLGFSSSIGAANPLYFQRFPLTNITNYNALGAQAVLFRGDDELQLTDTANWTRGNHAMHFGGEVRFSQYSQKSTNGQGFNLTTDDGWTQQWDTNVAGKTGGVESQYPIVNNYSGNSLASMEAGTWSATGTMTATTAGGNYFSSHYGALYFQDDWKLRPNLTINVGFRWEDPGRGIKDRFNRLTSQWDFTDENPVTSLIPSGTLVGLPVPNGFVGGPTYAGVNGHMSWQFKRVWYQFGPRAGFAYTWNQRTVIRGGMGLFYNDTAAGNLNAPSSIGYSTSNTYTASSSVTQGSNTLMVPQLNLANPFPTFQTATGNCGGNAQQCLETNLGQSSTFYPANFHPASQLNTSFGLERQLTTKDTIEVNYAGTRMYGPLYGVNNTDDMNHVSATAQAACDPLRGGLQSNCTGSVGQITNPFKGVAPFAGSSYYTASTIGKINFSRPYPQFLAITEAGIQTGKSWYNGIEAVYTHRTSWGLTANVGYTHSKFIVAYGYADVVNRIPSRVLGSQSGDVPNRLTALIVYKLPIARGSGFFPNMPRALDLVAGGWQTSNSYIVQSGLPQLMTSGWIVNQTANGGNLLPKKRYWAGNSNPWYPNFQAVGSDNYIQRLKPCVATVDPSSGGYDWIAQSVPLVTAGLCTTPNYIAINTSYQVNPNVEYTGARMGRNDQLNTNVSKNFALVEGMVFQLRMDAFNVFNHVQVYSSGYDTSTSDGTFGMYRLGTSGNGNQLNRQIQISGRLTW